MTPFSKHKNSLVTSEDMREISFLVSITGILHFKNEVNLASLNKKDF